MLRKIFYYGPRLASLAVGSGIGFGIHYYFIKPQREMQREMRKELDRKDELFIRELFEDLNDTIFLMANPKERNFPGYDLSPPEVEDAEISAKFKNGIKTYKWGFLKQHPDFALTKAIVKKVEDANKRGSPNFTPPFSTFEMEENGCCEMIGKNYQYQFDEISRL